MKIKSEKGSALFLVMLVMSLVTIAVMSLTKQVNNQIIFNMNDYESVQYEYLSESSIENSINEIIKSARNLEVSIEEEIEEDDNAIKIGFNHSEDCKNSGDEDCSHIRCLPIVRNGDTESSDGFYKLIYIDFIEDNTILESLPFMIDNAKLKNDDLLVKDIAFLLNSFSGEEIEEFGFNENNILDLTKKIIDSDGSDYESFEIYLENLGQIELKLEEVIDFINENYEDMVVEIEELEVYLSEIKEIKSRLDAKTEVPSTGLVEINIPEYISSTRNENGLLKINDLIDISNSTMFVDISKNGDNISSFEIEKVVLNGEEFEVIDNIITLKGHASKYSSQIVNTISVKVKFYIESDRLMYGLLDYKE